MFKSTPTSLTRTTLPLNHFGHAKPVIGRNLFELAATSEEVKSEFLPAGICVRLAGTEHIPLLNVSVRGVTVAYFRLEAIESKVEELYRNPHACIQLQNAAVLSITNEFGKAYINYSSDDFEKEFEVDWSREDSFYHCAKIMAALEEFCPNTIYALMNANLDSKRKDPVLLIDGVSFAGDYEPDPRLLGLLASIDAKVEVTKLEAELERQRLSKAESLEDKRARKNADYKLAEEHAKDSAERMQVLDSYFS